MNQIRAHTIPESSIKAAKNIVIFFLCYEDHFTQKLSKQINLIESKS
jgi:hypothetical protein